MGETKENEKQPIVGASNQPQKGGQPEKMSYEQVVDIANQLQSQNRELMNRLQNLANVYHRLDYLFKVVESPTQFDQVFVKACATEIQDIITIPSDKEEPKKD